MHTDPQNQHGTHDPHERHAVRGHADSPAHDSESPGYETTDVNVGGVLVFLAGLFGFVAVFFALCFGLGMVINDAIKKHDGPPNAWNQSGSPNSVKLQNLASNPEMEQKELQRVVGTFPSPRLQTDDGAQEVADLHAREDLLLEHYSYADQSKGAIRIPIEQAMRLIVLRGLPVAPAAATPDEAMTGDAHAPVQAPLTDGFARTAFEQDQIEARAERLKMERPSGEPETHAELTPAK